MHFTESSPRSLRSRFRFAKNRETLGLAALRLLRVFKVRSMVGLSGLEPPTSRLSGVRSNRLSYKPISWFERWFPTRPLVFPASAIAVRRTGGDERVRTDDPLLAKQVLSQLSYTPIFTCGRIPIHFLRIPFSRTLKIKQRSES